MEINNVTFQEDSQGTRSPSYRSNPGGAEVRRSLVLRPQTLAAVPLTTVTEELRFAAIGALLGYTSVGTDAVGGTRRWLERHLPHAYPTPVTPTNPDALPFLWATQIPSMDPIAGPDPAGVDASDRARYAAYRLQVVYETRPYYLEEDDADVMAPEEGPLAADPARPDEGDALRRGWGAYSRFVKKEVKGASRMVTMRQGQMKYEPDASLTPPLLASIVNEGISFTQSRAAITYTWMLVPVEAIPEEAIKNTINHINDAEFDNYGPATLLFLDFDYERIEGPLGDRLANVMYKFMWMPNLDDVDSIEKGWNSFPAVIRGRRRYWYMTTDGAVAGTDNVTYRYADFTALFRPPQG